LDPADIDGSEREKVRQKLTHPLHTGSAGGDCQSANGTEIFIESFQLIPNRRMNQYLRFRNIALSTKHMEQMYQCGSNRNKTCANMDMGTDMLEDAPLETCGSGIHQWSEAEPVAW
jgi:hypothetical protein